MSKNTACAALKAPIEQALKVAINNRDLAKAALSALKGTVNPTEKPTVPDTTLEDAQRVYDAAVSRVKKLRHEVDSVCSYRKCEQGIYSLVDNLSIPKVWNAL